MSPATNTEARAKDARYSSANFASIFAFLSTFNTLAHASIHEPEELEDVIKCAEGSAKLKDLALALLTLAMNRRPQSRTTEDQWPRCCSELAANTVYILKGLQVPEVAAESLDQLVGQDVAVRVDVLYWLCEAALMDNAAIKQLVDQEANKGRRASSMKGMKEGMVRLTPYAEIAKQRYWIFGTKTQQLYCEATAQRSRGKFELLAQTPEEFMRVAEEMKGHRLISQKDLASKLVEEVVPYLEAQIQKKERMERKMQRNALASANVHIYETRTRKRQRVNYADDGFDQLDC
ncbi:hypothetical protein GQ54DRAFT_295960 [Martensiomyces pterosporus]|nr:hypothetical protein GQ54DRAFT_295960 [Martensiomyces pterosporus]